MKGRIFKARTAQIEIRKILIRHVLIAVIDALGIRTVRRGIQGGLLVRPETAAL